MLTAQLITTDLLSLNQSDFGGWSNDPSRPDYACDAYRAMAPYWQICHDIRGGTPNVRAKAQYYLPRFEAEQMIDWHARVNMTFVNDWYASTLEEHVGLALGEPIVVSKDVPPLLRDLMEDINGEGDMLDVFANTVLDQAMHFGHGAILTDNPVTDNIKTLQDQRNAKIRPYAAWYAAPNILNWTVTTIGGTKMVTFISLREPTTNREGKATSNYRHFKQDVVYDEKTGRAVGLGPITWTLWQKVVSDSQTLPTAGGETFAEIGRGALVGPEVIPIRIVYGGHKIATLVSRPHLVRLAFSNLEETQVGSDYANIMHKCNVPTPCFIGRNPAPGNDKVQMGQGIDLNGQYANAFFLEPSGAALAATRQRLEDIRTQMKRQGATGADPGQGGAPLTATEAAMTAKQRNARLKKAVGSLQNALEGVLADFGGYTGTAKTEGTVKSGGSVQISTNFAGVQLDPQYLTVLLSAYEKNAFPLYALLYALQNGKLPEEFNAEDEAFKLLAASMSAEQDAADDAEVEEDDEQPVPKQKPKKPAKPLKPGQPGYKAPEGDDTDDTDE